MGLIDSLQNGYPTVQKGQGTSLLDLLQGLFSPNGNAPDTASDADKAYAAANKSADSGAGAWLQSLLPSAQAATPNVPYAMGTVDPAVANPSQGTGAPMGFGGKGQAFNVNPPGSAALTQAPQVPSPGAPAQPPIMSAPLASSGASAPSAAPQGPVDTPIGTAQGAPDVDIPDSSSGQGGILGSFSTQIASAAQSPEASKGLLGQFADTARSVSDKLTNLSPSASQALLASGLTILAGNDGTRNLAQLVGQGGIAGVNAYDSSKQNIIANNLAQQKLAQTSQQQAFENQIANKKVGIEAYNAQNAPLVVPPGSAVIQKNGQPLVAGTPQVARTVDTQGQDGKTYTVQLGQDGRMIGQPILKQDPYAGPLDASAQAIVNGAQTAAAQATQTYQRTAVLANALNSADFSGGVPAAINDTLTKLTGNKDAGQQLRGQLAQFANSSILSELPPGSASDKDIQLVRNGVPADNASKETWQAYLASVGRIQQASAVLQSAKADYASATRGNLGNLTRPTVINGIEYPAGWSFARVASGEQPPRQQQAPQQGQQQQGGGAVPFSSLQAEARRRGLIK